MGFLYENNNANSIVKGGELRALVAPNAPKGLSGILKGTKGGQVLPRAFLIKGYLCFRCKDCFKCTH
jgi:hypothetical protein